MSRRLPRSFPQSTLGEHAARRPGARLPGMASQGHLAEPGRPALRVALS